MSRTNSLTDEQDAWYRDVRAAREDRRKADAERFRVELSRRLEETDVLARRAHEILSEHLDNGYGWCANCGDEDRDVGELWPCRGADAVGRMLGLAPARDETEDPWPVPPWAP